MNGRILVDTNILVYAYDRSESEKQEQALSILEHLMTAKTGVISTQVLAEFFVRVTRKIQLPLSPAQAYERIGNYLRSWTVIEVNGWVVLEAVRGVRDYQFSYWDAQIWATAKSNQIGVVYSEDFNVGAVIEGVQFINPLTLNVK
jgi:predicted nucleic acid-binding protein